MNEAANEMSVTELIPEQREGVNEAANEMSVTRIDPGATRRERREDTWKGKIEEKIGKRIYPEVERRKRQ